RPKNFRDLVIISGLTHGTDVWAGNASELVAQGIPLDEVIGCRDDIMTYLISKELESVVAFTIMESVRKGKGLKPEWEDTMREHNVPEWYIESCKKIKYMFPKAHAVAYVLMAVRIAWFKVHLPHYFYIQFLTLRCDAYEIETMSKGIEAIQSRMTDIQSRMNNRNVENPASQKEKWLYDTLEVCLEIYARGYRISNVDLYKSKATQFSVIKGEEKVIIPPFNILDGLGDNVARSIEKAREEGEFLSKEDLKNRTQLSDTLIKKLDSLGCLKDLQERNQISLF
ncbi:MAG: PolC-type DNA polymerase III, partial [Erysipelotrichaceae bacterium]|nr:PolC-type DNA polymerase III [Erysipelotrichaceae bacterium]